MGLNEVPAEILGTQPSLAHMEQDLVLESDPHALIINLLDLMAEEEILGAARIQPQER